MRTMAELLSAGGRGLRVAVAAAADREVLATVKSGLNLNLHFTLFGSRERILALAAEEGLTDQDFDLVDQEDPVAAAKAATFFVADGNAGILMKGLVGTADLLRPVLDREAGLRTGRLLSHVALIELPGPRLVAITDAGVNIAPGLAEKADIIRNAAAVATSLGIERPRVAVLAALELVNPAMPATLDAAALAKMAERGQLGNVAVDGPLALDNAVSLDAAAHKGVVGEVAGGAHILLVPEITCGNVLYKALVHIAGYKAAGAVVGARVPLVVTSRSDSWETKLNSLVLAAALCR